MGELTFFLSTKRANARWDPARARARGRLPRHPRVLSRVAGSARRQAPGADRLRLRASTALRTTSRRSFASRWWTIPTGTRFCSRHRQRRRVTDWIEASSSLVTPTRAPARGRCHRSASRASAARGEHRADQDQREADAHADRELLVEDRDAEDGRDRRIHVDERRRADRPDLRDQREEDEECDRSADDGQRDDRADHARAWHLLGQAERRDRDVDQRGERRATPRSRRAQDASERWRCRITGPTA